MVYDSRLGYVPNHKSYLRDVSSHPLNLALRFLLELAVVISAAIWAWNGYDGLHQYLIAFGLPILLALLWGTFAVSDDPSRSGKTIVETPGPVRLVFEIAFFAFGAWILWDLNKQVLAGVLGSLTIVHYALSIDRIQWLLKR